MRACSSWRAAGAEQSQYGYCRSPSIALHGHSRGTTDSRTPLPVASAGRTHAIMRARHAFFLSAFAVFGSADARSNDSQDLLWGAYRPNLYFGLRPRLPQSLMTGLMWHGTQDFMSFRGAGWRLYLTQLPVDRSCQTPAMHANKEMA